MKLHLKRCIIDSTKTERPGRQSGMVENMKEYKKYRVDSFAPEYNIKYFDSEKEAREYGEAEKQNGKLSFLLVYLIDGRYKLTEQF